jgi:hypothetical protein
MARKSNASIVSPNMEKVKEEYIGADLGSTPHVSLLYCARCKVATYETIRNDKASVISNELPKCIVSCRRNRARDRSGGGTKTSLLRFCLQVTGALPTKTVLGGERHGDMLRSHASPTQETRWRSGPRSPQLPMPCTIAHPTPINSMATSGQRLMNFARSIMQCKSARAPPLNTCMHITSLSPPVHASPLTTNSQLLITSLVGSTDHSLHGLIL